MTWQPIDTAPKDRSVLLYYPQRSPSIVCGFWQEGELALFGSCPKPHWVNDRSHIHGVLNTREIQPTHWMALPNAPDHASGESATMPAADDAQHALAAAIDIQYHPLPERWLPELRLRLHAIDGGDPYITLRINTDGGGAFLALCTRGQIPFDPGELDFLPSIGNALCRLIDALYPYGVFMASPADDTQYALAAALERIDQLEQVLWHYILTYQVDDQHPDPAAETHRIMQEELQHHPWTTTENSK